MVDGYFGLFIGILTEPDKQRFKSTLHIVPEEISSNSAWTLLLRFKILFGSKAMWCVYSEFALWNISLNINQCLHCHTPSKGPLSQVHTVQHAALISNFFLPRAAAPVTFFSGDKGIHSPSRASPQNTAIFHREPPPLPRRVTSDSVTALTFAAFGHVKRISLVWLLSSWINPSKERNIEVIS